MRKIVTALAAAAFVLGTSGVAVEAAKAPAVTKMGCKIGKEQWNAVEGKCMPKVAKAKSAAKKKAS
jgi:hypothetical protein